MNKAVKLLIFIVIIPFIAQAQSTKRQMAGLSIGPSFTLSAFAKKDISDSTSGFAKTGISINFNYAFRVSHNFGLQILVNYSGNALNTSAYADELMKVHPEYGVSVESSKNWSSGGIFGGPYLRFPIGDLFSFDVRGLIGFFGSYSPQATIYTNHLTKPDDKGTYYRESSRSTGFGYLLGAGVKYRLSHYYLTAFADYVGADLNFKDASGWNWDDEPYTTTFSQKINYLALTFGVAYIL
jgi:hypothetical protein